VNRLCFGDNLEVLRESIREESVDLVYLDPPFNSNATYNLLFKTPKGQESDAQIAAFEDSWRWGEQAEVEFADLLHNGPSNVTELIRSLRGMLGENNMMAYLIMMASRLVELHRALKPQASLYLHCDPTAGHYLKIILDGIFGAENFRNEITWKRTFAHGNVGRNYGSIADHLLFYTKTDKYTWNQPFKVLSDEEIAEKYPMKDADGRRWQSVTLRNPSLRPNLHFSYKASNGITYHPHRNGWSCNRQRLTQYDREGRLHFPMKKDGALRLKMYADQSNGERVQNIWTDIAPIGALAAERLGYPTQKPLALLERIVRTSSNEGDIILDPFCGCGTAVHAAQNLKRNWIGIDVTHLAIAIVEKRLRDAFPGVKFHVHGTPTDTEGAKELANRDKYEFQYWACSLVNAQPFDGRKKGADGGIDGLIYFQDDKQSTKKIVVSVKGGQNISVQMLRDLRGVIEREKAAIGLFVTLADPTKPMRDEAVKAGFYTSSQGANFSRMQILTIAGLLEGRVKPAYPDPSMGGHTFKRTQIEQGTTTQGDLFSESTVLRNVQPIRKLPASRREPASKSQVRKSVAAGWRRPKVLSSR
jgi:site-specific DNA-methyltransferase (adenine-specific)